MAAQQQPAPAAAAAAPQPPAKRAKQEPPPEAANVIIQLESAEGEHAGPALDVPHTVTPQQLEVLLNGLLQHEEKTPYSFYIDGQELAGELGEHLRKAAVSVEQCLRVVFMPQAVFRVRPVARCTASMPGHSEAVLAVQFSPDGKQLASGSGDTTLRFWNLNTQLPQHECKGHTNWVLCVAWSPDAAMVASGDLDGNIWLWDPATGKALGRCTGHTKWITTLAWEPAHKALPSRRFVSGSKDFTVRVWDAATRRCLLTFGTHTMVVTCVRWGGEGLIYSSSKDTSINVWDAEHGRLVRTLKGHGHFVNTLALSTEAVLRTGAHDHTGRAPADPQAAMQVAQQRYDAVVGGQPERLVSGSDDNTMFLWTPAVSKAHVARMAGHVQLINQVTFSPDGRWVLSASFDKSVKLWDGVKGTFVATFRNHVGPVFQVAWSSDSRLFVSGSKDSTLKVWDVRGRKLMVDLPGHADEVFAVDWSPDGSGVASGGKDRRCFQMASAGWGGALGAWAGGGAKSSAAARWADDAEAAQLQPFRAAPGAASGASLSEVDLGSAPPSVTAAAGPAADQSVAARIERLERAERALAGREAAIAAREAELRLAGALLPKKNWPLCIPVMHHDLSELPPAQRGMVRLAYCCYLGLVACLTDNFAGACVMVGLHAPGAGGQPRGTARRGGRRHRRHHQQARRRAPRRPDRMSSWFLAAMYLLAGVPLAMLLWYRKLYDTVASNGSLGYMSFFAAFSVHTAFCTWAAIAVPIGGERWSFTGFVSALRAFDVAAAGGVVFLVGACAWSIEAAASLWCLKTVYFSFRGGGGGKQADASASAQAAAAKFAVGAALRGRACPMPRSRSAAGRGTPAAALLLVLVALAASPGRAQVTYTSLDPASCPAYPEPSLAQKAVSGFYEPIGQGPIAVAHALQLPCGNKFLMIEFGPTGKEGALMRPHPATNPEGFNILQVYDRDDGSWTHVPTDTNLVCGGWARFSNGQVGLFAGHYGTLQGKQAEGFKAVFEFDPTTFRLTPKASLSHKRWYPTTINLREAPRRRRHPAAAPGGAAAARAREPLSRTHARRPARPPARPPGSQRRYLRAWCGRAAGGGAAGAGGGAGGGRMCAKAPHTPHTPFTPPPPPPRARAGGTKPQMPNGVWPKAEGADVFSHASGTVTKVPTNAALHGAGLGNWYLGAFVLPTGQLAVMNSNMMQVINPYTSEALAAAPALPAAVKDLVWEFPRMGPQVHLRAGVLKPGQDARFEFVAFGGGLVDAELAADLRTRCSHVGCNRAESELRPCADVAVRIGLSLGLGDLTDGPGYNGGHEPWDEAWIYDPAAPPGRRFTETGARTRIARTYHATSILTQDGDIWVVRAGAAARRMGGSSNAAFWRSSHAADFSRSPLGVNENEVYHPPYLFWPGRPRIAAPPPTFAGYGATFELGYAFDDGPGDVTGVVLVNAGGVTHNYAIGHRSQLLEFRAIKSGPSSGTLLVTAPSAPELAPPAHYMLFLLRGDAYSAAAWLQLRKVGPGEVPVDIPQAARLVPELSSGFEPGGAPGFRLVLAPGRAAAARLAAPAARGTGAAGARVLLTGGAPAPGSAALQSSAAPLAGGARCWVQAWARAGGGAGGDVALTAALVAAAPAGPAGGAAAAAAVVQQQGMTAHAGRYCLNLMGPVDVPAAGVYALRLDVGAAAAGAYVDLDDVEVYCT
ncbi:NLE1 [Scenedesmus sp. PABB004]|nr:NLE1 [Scenedesmus sp. PABB004]